MLIQFLRHLPFVILFTALPAAAYGQNTSNGDLDALPDVAEEFEIRFVAKEPLTRNPCAMAFDVHGRLFIGMGPQYRSPTPNTPGDSVYLMIDSDNDGVFDKKHPFASGFNNIQGLCWHGDDLWIANAPDLTIVRDTDNDDVADEYIRLYTDLGNLEHGLHGLTWGPDGRMYMSKGNSKGHNGPKHYAPLPFRDLAGVAAPSGTSIFPKPVVSDAANYVKTYHDPADDWGREGGVLSCLETGEDLRIESRGYRNPWDIAFDHEFNFLGTDNDQNQGDRLFHSFYGAHYGWGHNWSAHWTCENHLPTPELAGPLFGGSGTGITYFDSPAFPPAFRGVWMFNDWLQRRTHFFKPQWKGAHLTTAAKEYDVLVSGGDSLFKPTDLEVGPNGSLYILGWGREYGVQWNDKQEQVNEGRVFEVRWRHNKAKEELLAKHQRWQKPLSDWTTKELISGLDDILAVRRIAAQEALILRKDGPSEILLAFQDESDESHDMSIQQATWAIWALIRNPYTQKEQGHQFMNLCLHGPIHIRIQAMRALRQHTDSITNISNGQIPLDSDTLEILETALSDKNARLRFEAYQFITQIDHLPPKIHPPLLEALKVETDYICFYAGWHVLKQHYSSTRLKALLLNDDSSLQLAALLAAAERRETITELIPQIIQSDSERLRNTAALYATRKSGNSMFYINNPGGEFTDTISVSLLSYLKPSQIYYTLDGTNPSNESPRWPGSLNITRSCTLKFAVYSGDKQIGPIAEYQYERLTAQATAERQGILSILSETNRLYRVSRQGPQKDTKAYTDRDYILTDVPKTLENTVFIQTPNDDSEEFRDTLVSIELAIPSTIIIAHDTRITEPSWLSNWEKIKGQLTTNDTTFGLFQKNVPAGKLTLGPNRPDTRGSASQYLIFLQPGNLKQLADATTQEAVTAAIPTADAQRGKALFFATGGAGCFKCHDAKPADTPTGFGPNLSFLKEQRNPNHIIKSLLTPSSEIKEGFATQVIITHDGRTITGILKHETGESITLNQPNEKSVTISRDKIDERVSQKVSAMPAFDRLLTPQQIADLVKYLLEQ